MFFEIVFFLGIQVKQMLIQDLFNFKITS